MTPTNKLAKFQEFLISRETLLIFIFAFACGTWNDKYLSTRENAEITRTLQVVLLSLVQQGEQIEKFMPHPSLRPTTSANFAKRSAIWKK